MKRLFPLAIILFVTWLLASKVASAADTEGSAKAEAKATFREAMAWYDTLGYPDAKDLRYVRVATGLASRTGNQPPERIFVEGFLLREDAESFTVFMCSANVPGRYDVISYESLTQLTEQRFVFNKTGPVHEHVGYEVLDFGATAEATLAKVKEKLAQAPYDLQGARYFSPRIRLFAFARACQQKGLAETASALMRVAASIPDEQTEKVEPQKLTAFLQQQLGDAFLWNAEEAFADKTISWAEHLKKFEGFAARYPASSKVAYAREAVEVLKKMVAEEAAYHPKPVKEMSPAEQAADAVYQLRNLHKVIWIMEDRYPVDSPDEAPTPVHRIVDLGLEAVPQLIAALGDRRFTRTLNQGFLFGSRPEAMRVGNVALDVLNHLSARNFYPAETDDGKLLRGTSQEQARAWWAEVQRKGEQQVLVEAALAGGDDDNWRNAARILARKYPQAALATIEARIKGTEEPAQKAALIELASLVADKKAVPLLKALLAGKNGVYSQVQAAEALLAQGDPEGVPVIIEAWKKIQPRLPANQDDAYSDAGRIITFLARSGQASAIEALAVYDKKTPVDVRLAMVKVFLSGGESMVASGTSVSVNAEIAELPGGPAGLAIERLLIHALDDSEARAEMSGTYKKIDYTDPRVCDMAAVVLAERWPKKYQFEWSASSAERDAQIGKLRDQWRAEQGAKPKPGKLDAKP